jgi:2-(1,2-epoxy-1,2-dihydrophenyl)acetyl-CoA isomerase
LQNYIDHSSDGGVVLITINRPESRNALTYPMLETLFGLVDELDADDRCRVIILTGSGGSFCAGTDLKFLSAIPQEERGMRTKRARRGALWDLTTVSKPIIAAIDGAAVGLGVELTSHCDVRIASTRARFAWNFVQRGLVPDTGAGTWLLPRLIGFQEAFRLVMSGEFVDAARALELGFVRQVVEPEDLIDAAHAEARRYLAGSPFAQRMVKQQFYAGLSRSLPEHIVEHLSVLEACFRSWDHHEGVAAFLERRDPHFRGS